jgi:hypothetical protein
MNPPSPESPLRSIRAFVWDLADDHLDDILSRLHDHGIGGLHAALAFHGGRFLSVHNPKRTVVQPPDGVVYFQPDSELYEELIPRPHPEFGSGSLIHQLADSLQSWNMSFTSWIVLFNNRMLATHFPQCCCVNAMGDRLEGMLCPSNPAVRQYAGSLVEDLSRNIGNRFIELEDFCFPDFSRYIGMEWRQVPIGTELNYLLSLCFCPHCRESAESLNIQVHDLQRQVGRLVRSALNDDISDRRLADELGHPGHPISRMAEMRSNSISELLLNLNNIVAGRDVSLGLRLHDHPDEIWRWGVELNKISSLDLNMTVDACSDPGETINTLNRWNDLLSPHQNRALDVRLSIQSPDIPPDFRNQVESAEAASFHNLVLSHYGLTRSYLLEMLPVTVRP